MHRRLLLVAVAVIAAVSIAGLTGARAASSLLAKPTAVAVIDLQKVVSGLKAKTKIDADNKQALESFNQAKDHRDKQIAEIRNDLDLLAPGSPAHSQKVDEAFEATIELNVWTQVQARRIQSEASTRTQGLRKRINSTISQLAKELGYDIVLLRQQAVPLRTNQQGQATFANIQIVAYHTEAVDITSQIVQRMNNEFEAGL